MARSLLFLSSQLSFHLSRASSSTSHVDTENINRVHVVVLDCVKQEVREVVKVKVKVKVGAKLNRFRFALGRKIPSL